MKRIAITFIALIILPLTARAEVMEATLANDLPLLRSALVDGDHDVNATTANGSTALHVAAAYGYDEIVAELLSAGANVDARSHLGPTALILAAQSGHLGSVQMLLAAGADRTALSFSGGSALSYAEGYGHRNIVDALAPGAPVAAPTQHLPVIMAVLSLALLAAIVGELHRSSRPRKLAPAIH